MKHEKNGSVSDLPFTGLDPTTPALVFLVPVFGITFMSMKANSTPILLNLEPRLPSSYSPLTAFLDRDRQLLNGSLASAL